MVWLYTTDPRLVAGFFFVVGFGACLVFRASIRRG